MAAEPIDSARIISVDLRRFIPCTSDCASFQAELPSYSFSGCYTVGEPSLFHTDEQEYKSRW